jgi:trimethylamine--corrinoid protein Co-methyltransferase
MDSPHTLAHFRERWYPTLIERHNYDGWLAHGGQDLGQRAAARVDEILAEHQPEPLPADVQGRLREIVQRASD